MHDTRAEGGLQIWVTHRKGSEPRWPMMWGCTSEVPTTTWLRTTQFHPMRRCLWRSWLAIPGRRRSSRMLQLLGCNRDSGVNLACGMFAGLQHLRNALRNCYGTGKMNGNYIVTCGSSSSGALPLEGSADIHIGSHYLYIILYNYIYTLW